MLESLNQRLRKLAYLQSELYQDEHGYVWVWDKNNQTSNKLGTLSEATRFVESAEHDELMAAILT